MGKVLHSMPHRSIRTWKKTLTQARTHINTKLWSQSENRSSLWIIYGLLQQKTSQGIYKRPQICTAFTHVHVHTAFFLLLSYSLGRRSVQVFPGPWSCWQEKGSVHQRGGSFQAGDSSHFRDQRLHVWCHLQSRGHNPPEASHCRGICH